jgi:cytochrome c553
LGHALALPVSANETTNAVCARCHGIDGIAMNADTPHVNGQSLSYLVDSMDKFLSKKRPTGVAEHYAETVKAEDIQATVQLYASSKAIRPKQETDPEKAARGEIIYSNRCIKCHLDNGRDAEQDVPLLAAQSLPYLVAQNRLFVSGKRKFGFLQDEAYQGLSDDDLEAVSHFFAAQDQIAPKISTNRKKRR